MIDQSTAIDNIQTRIAQTAAWRRSLCDRYPADARNVPAADRLECLSQADGRQVRPAVWDAIGPHIKSRIFDDVLNEAAREVGFRNRPKDLNAFLVIVADKIDFRTGGVL